MVTEKSATESCLVVGQLWSRLTEQSRYALQVGALQPIPTEQTLFPTEKAQFVVRVLANIQRKKAAAVRQRLQNINPFLPYDPDLFVGNFSPTHLGLLNKYNAVDHHLLIVTRQFEDQRALLTVADFTAALQVLQEIPGLIFYNSGPSAGASQPHRHLQWIPFLKPESSHCFPLAHWYHHQLERSICGQASSAPFQLAIAPISDCLSSGATCHQHYQNLLQILHLLNTEQHYPCPYNLLMTREWLAIIPRSRESYQSIEVNALGFAGGLLVKNQTQLKILQNLGPWDLLQAVAIKSIHSDS